jgi:hypothetical protein
MRKKAMLFSKNNRRPKKSNVFAKKRYIKERAVVI